MSTLTKPERIRSRENIQNIREESGHACEYVDPVTGERCSHPAEGEPHHIRTRGAGGDDRRENLIHLCGCIIGCFMMVTWIEMNCSLSLPSVKG